MPYASRSTRCSSSRTLPSHSCAISDITEWAAPVVASCSSIPIRARKCRTSSGMSLRRSRSGGTTMWSTDTPTSSCSGRKGDVIPASASRAMSRKRTSSDIASRPPSRGAARRMIAWAMRARRPGVSAVQSSSTTVPPRAVSRTPIRPSDIDDRAIPNSSCSSASALASEHRTTRYGLAARSDRSWMRRATVSLPTPASPVMRTVRWRRRRSADQFAHMHHRTRSADE